VAAVPGIGPRTAVAVVEALAERRSASLAVNTATGEILDDVPADSTDNSTSADSGTSPGAGP
jgi:excinuclease ABC subunit C